MVTRTRANRTLPFKPIMTPSTAFRAYEDLLTSALEAEVNARTAEGWRVDVTSADSTVRPSFWRVMSITSFDARSKGFPKKTALSRPTRSPWRIDWWRCSSNLVRWLTTGSPTPHACYWKRSNAGHWAGHDRSPTSTLSLRQTGLLVNGRRDVQIASEIAREIPSADRIDLLCAFVRHSGCGCSVPSLKNGCERAHACA